MVWKMVKNNSKKRELSYYEEGRTHPIFSDS